MAWLPPERDVSSLDAMRVRRPLGVTRVRLGSPRSLCRQVGKEGWLWKEGRHKKPITKAWAERWFMLDEVRGPPCILRYLVSG